MKIATVCCALLLASAAARAQSPEFPIPRIMSDIPATSGSWRMEALQMPGTSAEMARQMGPMTVCQSAAEAMARRDPKRKEQCKSRLVEDGASRAVIDSTCTGDDPMTMRSTVTRAGPRAYEVASDITRAGKTEAMRMRMTYTGPCSEKDSVVTTSKDSPLCQQGAAQMAQMDPQTQCKGASGPQRDQCLKMMADAKAQFEKMCK